ncbi:mitogen-activated protein kinase phosphatase 1, putative [Plasmodium sp. gorilla clade G2]|uniref:mitogen-activated protein kinase phosphatase 1, putative n=1 Tax=Plasmodium sp. gorilla clade G2 TaxID=880535 RepID=UPI000D20C012|nr:mitogen-activated protein kinase phosphatase 1, putative [Plasmodium sp. gorilla clade G2]SOV17363.1 mitogen-activated protein kinase phosphatase 1, putative [Plasmodium sp. gorilla clade G2]
MEYKSIDFEELKKKVKEEKINQKNNEHIECSKNNNFVERLRDQTNGKYFEESNNGNNNLKGVISSSLKNNITCKIINSFYIYNYIQLLLNEGSNKNVYILDIRNEELFNQGHIKSSINIYNKKMMIQINKEMICKDNLKIIFYDHNNMNNIYDDCINLYNIYFSNIKVDNIYILKGGYIDFEREYSFLCVNTNVDIKGEVSSHIYNSSAYINYPIKMFDNLYLGNIIHINNIFINDYLNIKYIYDFTSTGFVIKRENKETRKNNELLYFRYNVYTKTFENTNSLNNESINYYNFLDIHMIYEVITSMISTNENHISQNNNNNNNYYYYNSNDNDVIYNDQNNNVALYTNQIKDNNMSLITQNKEQLIYHINSTHNNKQINMNNQNNILIICNHGMKNPTSEKTNSISLIICMCYIMYIKKYNPNLIIAYMLKIYNNWSINSQTKSFLESFYQSLIKCNYNLQNYYSKKNVCNNKEEQINISTNNHNQNESLLNIITSDNYRKLFKKYELNKSYIYLQNDEKYVLNIKQQHIILDINIIKQQINDHDMITSYEYVIMSLLFYIYNFVTINYEHIYEVLQIITLILNKKQNYDDQHFLIFPYISLVIINICKILTYNKFENNIINNINSENYNNVNYTIFHLIYKCIIICIDILINNNDISNHIIKEEFHVTCLTNQDYIKNKNIDQKFYIILLSLKYFLITLLYLYLNPHITNTRFLSVDEIFHLLKKIDTFSDYYYSVFQININLFQSENYEAKICSGDYLPIYFSDILRPFIVINNYIN